MFRALMGGGGRSSSESRKSSRSSSSSKSKSSRRRSTAEPKHARSSSSRKSSRGDDRDRGLDDLEEEEEEEDARVPDANRRRYTYSGLADASGASSYATADSGITEEPERIVSRGNMDSLDDDDSDYNRRRGQYREGSEWDGRDARVRTRDRDHGRDRSGSWDGSRRAQQQRQQQQQQQQPLQERTIWGDDLEYHRENRDRDDADRREHRRTRSGDTYPPSTSAPPGGHGQFVPAPPPPRVSQFPPQNPVSQGPPTTYARPPPSSSVSQFPAHNPVSQGSPTASAGPPPPPGISQFPPKIPVSQGPAKPSSSSAGPYDPHVQNQFPGQFPIFAAPPFPPVGNPAGAAADYYGDHGESVSAQPGVRPNPPTVIPNSQTHLMAASSTPNPPPEPSSMGQVGAAAAYYDDNDDAPGKPSSSSSKPPKPSNPGKPTGSGQASAAFTFGAGGPPGNTGMKPPPMPDKPTEIAQSSAFTTPAAAAASYGIGSLPPHTGVNSPPEPSAGGNTQPVGISLERPPHSYGPGPGHTPTGPIGKPHAGPGSPPVPAGPPGLVADKPPQTHNMGLGLGAAAAGAAAAYAIGHHQNPHTASPPPPAGPPGPPGPPPTSTFTPPVIGTAQKPPQPYGIRPGIGHPPGASVGSLQTGVASPPRPPGPPGPPGPPPNSTVLQPSWTTNTYKPPNSHGMGLGVGLGAAAAGAAAAYAVGHHHDHSAGHNQPHSMAPVPSGSPPVFNSGIGNLHTAVASPPVPSGPPGPYGPPLSTYTPPSVTSTAEKPPQSHGMALGLSAAAAGYAIGHHHDQFAAHSQPPSAAPVPPGPPAASTTGVGNSPPFVPSGPHAPLGPPGPAPSTYTPPAEKPPHPSGVTPVLGAAAAAAAAGYVMGHHHDQSEAHQQSVHEHSVHEQSSSSYSHHSSQHVTQGYEQSSHNGLNAGGTSIYGANANAALLAAGAAGAAGYAASTAHAAQETSTGNYNATTTISSGQMYQSGSMAFQQRQRGPLAKFIDFWRDPDGVGEYEDYTETIGVCKYCFEPGTTSQDAPRKHHYPPRRRYSSSSGSSRVDKFSRSSSEESRRRKVSKRKSWLTGLLAGYAAKSVVGNAEEHGDKQTSQSEQVTKSRYSSDESESHSTFNQQSSNSRHTHQCSHGSYSPVRANQNYPSEGNSCSHGALQSSSPTEHSSVVQGAALGATVGSAAVAVSEHRHHSRSPDKDRRRNDSSSSDSSSFHRLSRQKSATSSLRSWFMGNSEDQKTSQTKKRRGFFSFRRNNSSSSSLDDGLAFGGGLSPPKSAKSKKGKKGRDVDAALTGLTAAATALAASSHGQRRRTGEILAKKDIRSRPSYESREDDDEWEDADSDHSSTSVSSGLAFGETGAFGHRSESVSSSNSGTSRWGWRWGRKKDNKKEEQRRSSSEDNHHLSAGAAAAAGAVAGAALVSTFTKDTRATQQRQEEGQTQGTSGSLQYVLPVPTSDPTRFDVTKMSSSSSPGDGAQPPLVRPGPIHLQQPQPVAPVSQAVYYTQPESPNAQRVPVGPPVSDGSFHRYDSTQSQVAHSREWNQSSSSSSSAAYLERRDINTASGVSEMTHSHQKHDSFPVFPAGPMQEIPIKGRPTSSRDSATVQFQLTQEQEEKQHLAELRERRRQEVEREEERPALQLIDTEAELVQREKREREQREHQERERQEWERQQRDREQREREQREREQWERQERERQERERQEWERQQRDREQWERERERRDREQREREQREREQRDRDRWEREERERRQREREQRELQERERQEWERQQREREQRAREQWDKPIILRDKEQELLEKEGEREGQQVLILREKERQLLERERELARREAELRETLRREQEEEERRRRHAAYQDACTQMSTWRGEAERQTTRTRTTQEATSTSKYHQQDMKRDSTTSSLGGAAAAAATGAIAGSMSRTDAEGSTSSRQYSHAQETEREKAVLSSKGGGAPAGGVSGTVLRRDTEESISNQYAHEHHQQERERHQDSSSLVASPATGAIVDSAAASILPAKFTNDNVARNSQQRHDESREKRRAERRYVPEPERVTEVTTTQSSSEVSRQVVISNSQKDGQGSHEKTSAFRSVSRTTPTTHDNYAEFFAPEELRHGSTIFTRGRGRSRSRSPSPLPVIIEIDQAHETQSRSMPISSGEPIRNPDRLPWPVPQLRLIPPIPFDGPDEPGVIERTTTITTTATAPNPPDAPHGRVGESRSDKTERQTSSSQVSWGDHQTHDYEVLSSASELTASTTEGVDSPERRFTDYSSSRDVYQGTQGDYDQDVEFAATLAAAAAAAGFDPALVSGDQTYRSSSRSPFQAEVIYRSPWPSEIGSRNESHGFVEGEVETSDGSTSAEDTQRLLSDTEERTVIDRVDGESVSRKMDSVAASSEETKTESRSTMSEARGVQDKSGEHRARSEGGALDGSVSVPVTSETTRKVEVIEKHGEWDDKGEVKQKESGVLNNVLASESAETKRSSSGCKDLSRQGQSEAVIEASETSEHRRREQSSRARRSSFGDSLSSNNSSEDSDGTGDQEEDKVESSYTSHRQRREEKRRQQNEEIMESRKVEGYEKDRSKSDDAYPREQLIEKAPEVSERRINDGGDSEHPSLMDAAPGLGLGTPFQQQPRTSPSSPSAGEKTPKSQSRPVSPESAQGPGQVQQQPRRSGPIESPTAVPVHFFRPATSPRLPGSSPMTTGSPTAPVSPIRHRRLNSTEFRNSREIRPLWLVERHGAVKAESLPDEPLPSLPSSKTTSRSASATSLPRRGDQMGDDLPSFLPGNPPRHGADAEEHRHGFLDSQQATPTAPMFGSTLSLPTSSPTKKEKLKYEFHSPWELLQDPSGPREFPFPQSSMSGETSQGRELSVGTSDAGVLKREDDSDELSLEKLPPLPDSQPSTPAGEPVARTDVAITAREGQASVNSEVLKHERRELELDLEKLPPLPDNGSTLSESASDVEVITPAHERQLPTSATRMSKEAELPSVAKKDVVLEHPKEQRATASKSESLSSSWEDIRQSDKDVTPPPIELAASPKDDDVSSAPPARTAPAMARSDSSVEGSGSPGFVIIDPATESGDDKLQGVDGAAEGTPGEVAQGHREEDRRETHIHLPGVASETIAVENRELVAEGTNRTLAGAAEAHLEESRREGHIQPSDFVKEAVSAEYMEPVPESTGQALTGEQPEEPSADTPAAPSSPRKKRKNKKKKRSQDLDLTAPVPTPAPETSAANPPRYGKDETKEESEPANDPVPAAPASERIPETVGDSKGIKSKASVLDVVTEEASSATSSPKKSKRDRKKRRKSKGTAAEERKEEPGPVDVVQPSPAEVIAEEEVSRSTRDLLAIGAGTGQSVEDTSKPIVERTASTGEEHTRSPVEVSGETALQPQKRPEDAPSDHPVKDKIAVSDERTETSREVRDSEKTAPSSQEQSLELIHRDTTSSSEQVTQATGDIAVISDEPAHPPRSEAPEYIKESSKPSRETQFEGHVEDAILTSEERAQDSSEVVDVPKGSSPSSVEMSGESTEQSSEQREGTERATQDAVQISEGVFQRVEQAIPAHNELSGSSEANTTEKDIIPTPTASAPAFREEVETAESSTGVVSIQPAENPSRPSEETGPAEERKETFKGLPEPAPEVVSVLPADEPSESPIEVAKDGGDALQPAVVHEDSTRDFQDGSRLEDSDSSLAVENAPESQGQASQNQEMSLIEKTPLAHHSTGSKVRNEEQTPRVTENAERQTGTKDEAEASVEVEEVTEDKSEAEVASATAEEGLTREEHHLPAQQATVISTGLAEDKTSRELTVDQGVDSPVADAPSVVPEQAQEILAEETLEGETNKKGESAVLTEAQNDPKSVPSASDVRSESLENLETRTIPVTGDVQSAPTETDEVEKTETNDNAAHSSKGISLHPGPHPELNSRGPGPISEESEAERAKKQEQSFPSIVDETAVFGLPASRDVASADVAVPVASEGSSSGLTQAVPEPPSTGADVPVYSDKLPSGLGQEVTKAEESLESEAQMGTQLDASHTQDTAQVEEVPMTAAQKRKAKKERQKRKKREAAALNEQLSSEVAEESTRSAVVLEDNEGALDERPTVQEVETVANDATEETTTTNTESMLAKTEGDAKEISQDDVAPGDEPSATEVKDITAEELATTDIPAQAKGDTELVLEGDEAALNESSTVQETKAEGATATEEVGTAETETTLVENKENIHESQSAKSKKSKKKDKKKKRRSHSLVEEPSAPAETSGPSVNPPLEPILATEDTSAATDFIEGSRDVTTEELTQDAGQVTKHSEVVVTESTEETQTSSKDQAEDDKNEGASAPLTNEETFVQPKEPVSSSRIEEKTEQAEERKLEDESLAVEEPVQSTGPADRVESLPRLATETLLDSAPQSAEVEEEAVTVQPKDHPLPESEKAENDEVADLGYQKTEESKAIQDAESSEEKKEMQLGPVDVLPEQNDEQNEIVAEPVVSDQPSIGPDAMPPVEDAEQEAAPSKSKEKNKKKKRRKTLEDEETPVAATAPCDDMQPGNDKDIDLENSEVQKLDENTQEPGKSKDEGQDFMPAEEHRELEEEKVHQSESLKVDYDVPVAPISTQDAAPKESEEVSAQEESHSAEQVLHEVAEYQSSTEVKETDANTRGPENQNLDSHDLIAEIPTSARTSEGMQGVSNLEENLTTEQSSHGTIEESSSTEVKVSGSEVETAIASGEVDSEESQSHSLGEADSKQTECVWADEIVSSQVDSQQEDPTYSAYSPSLAPHSAPQHSPAEPILTSSGDESSARELQTGLANEEATLVLNESETHIQRGKVTKTESFSETFTDGKKVESKTSFFEEEVESSRSATNGIHSSETVTDSVENNDQLTDVVKESDLPATEFRVSDAEDDPDANITEDTVELHTEIGEPKISSEPIEKEFEVPEVSSHAEIKIFDIQESQFLHTFTSAIRNVTTISLATDYPTLPSVMHSFINSYKNVLAVAVATKYSWPDIESLKKRIPDSDDYPDAAPASSFEFVHPSDFPPERSTEEEPMKSEYNPSWYEEYYRQERKEATQVDLEEPTEGVLKEEEERSAVEEVDNAQESLSGKEAREQSNEGQERLQTSLTERQEEVIFEPGTGPALEPATEENPAAMFEREPEDNNDAQDMGVPADEAASREEEQAQTKEEEKRGNNSTADVDKQTTGEVREQIDINPLEGSKKDEKSEERLSQENTPEPVDTIQRSVEEAAEPVSASNPVPDEKPIPESVVELEPDAEAGHGKPLPDQEAEGEMVSAPGLSKGDVNVTSPDEKPKEEAEATSGKQSKIDCNHPSLEQGYSIQLEQEKPSPSSENESAEKQITEQDSHRDSAVHLSGATVVANDTRDGDYTPSPVIEVRDSSAERPAFTDSQGDASTEQSTSHRAAKKELRGTPMDLAIDVEVDPSFDISVSSDGPGEEIRSIKIHWEDAKERKTAKGVKVPSATKRQTPMLSGSSRSKSESLRAKASSELRLSRSIHGQQQPTSEETPTQKPPQSLFGGPIGDPEPTSPPATPSLRAIQKHGSRDRVEKAGRGTMAQDSGTPRLEMKPEHVLPPPETPLIQSTDKTLARKSSDKDEGPFGIPQANRPGGKRSMSGFPGEIFKTPEQDMPILRPSSVASVGSVRSMLSMDDVRLGRPPSLRRKTGGDLRSASSKQQHKSKRQPPLDVNIERISSSSSYDPVTDKGKRPVRDMTDVYEGWGETPAASRSPTRPPSVRHRRSMQHLQELEARLDRLISENHLLTAARDAAESKLKNVAVARRKSDQALNTSTADLRDKEAEVEQLRNSVDWLQKEVTRLTEENTELTATNANLTAAHEDELKTIHEQSAHELNSLRSENEQLATGMKDIVRREVDAALVQKNAELRRLREQLETTRDKVRELQQQISASLHDNVLVFRDEEYFDASCQKLCGHVQQWVLRFSKHSDHRRCRRLSDLHDEKLADRFDNAILDGSDVEAYLADRVRRRDVFMSVVMSMVWEYIFTRYLFGMDREQRQKLKALEKQLNEVGPRRAVHRWRATTLTLLAKRPPFARQRQNDTEAVALEIFETLSRLLPPPAQVETQLLDSLRKVLRVAVDLSIEMRTQLAEYIMLPPQQPEYDINGDLARQVHFNASLMNERSGETTSNEELEAQRATVRVVLFPLVVKKGNDSGEGDDEIVVCPAQVLITRPNKDRKVSKVLSDDRMSAKSVHSIAPSATMDI